MTTFAQATKALATLLPPAKEPIAIQLLKLKNPTFEQQKYIYEVLKRYEFTLRMVGVGLPPCPEPLPELPKEPYFVDFIKGKFILRLSDKQAEFIHTVPLASYDRATHCYVVPYRLFPVLQLHKFVKNAPGLHYTEAAKQAILEMYVEMRARYKASMAHDADIDMGEFGLPLDPYQKAGIKGALRFLRGFIADEMGLGKTREALGVLFLARSFPALIVPPASVTKNWEKEAIGAFKALIGRGEFRIWRCKSTKAPRHICASATNQLSLLNQADTTFDVNCPRCQFDNSHIIIANYEKLKAGWKCQYDKDGKKIKGRKPQKGERRDIQLSPVAHAIAERGLQSIIIDESYVIKEEDSQNTKAVATLARGCRVRLALSGTPIKSRTSELIAPLKVLDRLEDLGGEEVFYREYIGDIDPKGSQQELKLHSMLRATGYIQRNKRDVRTDLQPIRYGTIWVDIDNREEYERVKTDVVNWCAEQAVLKVEFQSMLEKLSPLQQEDAIQRKKIETAMRVMQAQALIRIGALKRVAARGKVAAVKQWIQENFLPTEKKLVVFAWQRDIQYDLQKTFNCLHIFGKDNTDQRHLHMEIFQNEAGNMTGLNSRLLIASNGAAKDGVNLDKADDLLRVEQMWTPAEMRQIAGRIDRHEVHNINIWDAIADDTIEVDIQEKLKEKGEILDAVTRGKSARKEVTREKIVDELFNSLASLSTHAPDRALARQRAEERLRMESTTDRDAILEAAESEAEEDAEAFDEAV